MVFLLPELPYAPDLLAPHLSAHALALHHGKHHGGYVGTLNKLILGTRFADLPLEQIIYQSYGTAGNETIFNNAAQHWNHSFFWRSMTGTEAAPPPALAAQIDASFGSLAGFREAFCKIGLEQFGSGWLWLVQQSRGGLALIRTGNAVNPQQYGQRALLCCDLWEHAYYPDYENRRAEYLEVFAKHLVDWQAVAQRLAGRLT